MNNKLPKHIAIIMDGNGRWAKKRGMIRTEGHKKGVETLEKILKYSDKLGIKYLSVYAFSTENWNRPRLEVETILMLFNKYLKNKFNDFMEQNVRLVISGNRERLSKSLNETIDEITNKLKNNTGIVLNICFNYGGRLDILESVKKTIENGEDITEDNISKNLYNSFIPNPDLLIRTGGEFRISNYMLWQIAYSEIYVSDLLWPDFDEKELDKSINSFCNRDRRYGNVEE
ncbi:polyprenyl diphosphate synthase [Pseudostreptobacillus sp.]